MLRRLNEYPATAEAPAAKRPRVKPYSMPTITGRNCSAARAGPPASPDSTSAFIQLKAMVGPSPFRGRSRRSGPPASAEPRRELDGRVKRPAAPRPISRAGPPSGRGASAGRRVSGSGSGRRGADDGRAAANRSTSPTTSSDSTRRTPSTLRATASASSTSSASPTVPPSVTTPLRARTSIGRVPSRASLTSAVRTRTAVRASATAGEVSGAERAAQPPAPRSNARASSEARRPGAEPREHMARGRADSSSRRATGSYAVSGHQRPDEPASGPEPA